MRLELRTRCGCSRFLQWPDGERPGFIEIPLTGSHEPCEFRRFIHHTHNLYLEETHAAE